MILRGILVTIAAQAWRWRVPAGILLHFLCIALIVQGCATMVRVAKQ